MSSYNFQKKYLKSILILDKLITIFLVLRQVRRNLREYDQNFLFVLQPFSMKGLSHEIHFKYNNNNIFNHLNQNIITTAFDFTDISQSQRKLSDLNCLNSIEDSINGQMFSEKNSSQQQCIFQIKSSINKQLFNLEQLPEYDTQDTVLKQNLMQIKLEYQALKFEEMLLEQQNNQIIQQKRYFNSPALMKVSKFVLLLVILYQFLAVKSSGNYTEYDFQILFDQFDDLKDIHLIFKNNQIKKMMSSNAKSFIGSVIGFPDSGKTFFLNKLQDHGYQSKVNLPSGYHVSTRGISGLVNTFSDESYHLWIDSEGMQKAVLIDNDKLLWQDSEIEDINKTFKYQQTVNEEFQKNDIFEKIYIQLLLKISNTVILIINSLSEQEQKYIFQLYKSYTDENNNNQKQTIIIFNCKFATNQEELQQNVDILEKNYPLKSLKKDGINYYQDKRFPNIKFFVLANNESSLGQKINPFVYKNIAQIARQKFVYQNILSIFKEYFNNNIRRYVNFDFKENDIKYQNLYAISDNQDKISLVYELKSQIKPKILSISPLGQNQDVIKYDILKNEQNGYLYFQIKVFLPGEIEFIQYQVFKEKQTEYSYLSVKYKQKKDQFYKELEEQEEEVEEDIQQPSPEEIQFDVQHEFDIEITQQIGVAILLENQPTQNEKEKENGIYSFQIQFIGDN
ncbi:hypothetical protein ABPG74_020697 [Tetrahymena malaccensis]